MTHKQNGEYPLSESGDAFEKLLDTVKELLKDRSKDLDEHARRSVENAHSRSKWAIWLSGLASIISIVAALVAAYSGRVEEIHNSGRELGTLVTKLAAADARHELGNETNIIAKRAYALSMSLLNSDSSLITCWIGKECGGDEVSVPELAIVAKALYDVDDEIGAEKVAKKAVDLAADKEHLASSLDTALANRVLGTILFGDHKPDAELSYTKAVTGFLHPDELWVLYDNAKTELEWTRTADSIGDCEIAQQHGRCLKLLRPHLLSDDGQKIDDMIRLLQASVKNCTPKIGDTGAAPSQAKCLEPILQRPVQGLDIPRGDGAATLSSPTR